MYCKVCFSGLLYVYFHDQLDTLRNTLVSVLTCLSFFVAMTLRYSMLLYQQMLTKNYVLLLKLLKTNSCTYKFENLFCFLGNNKFSKDTMLMLAFCFLLHFRFLLFLCFSIKHVVVVFPRVYRYRKM